MKKIIHLSDLHIGKGKREERFGKMVSRLITLYKPEEYIVVITGDIVQNANNEDDFNIAMELINNIKDANFHVLIVPGNHDYGTGNKAKNDGLKRFKDKVYSNPNENFPKFDKIDNIGFIGLDSMEGEIKNEEGTWADGELGTDQLMELKELLTKEKVKSCEYVVVYLHHHPFDMGGFIKKYFHGLDDAEALREALSGHKIDALLFGHNHDGKPWIGHWDIKHTYDGGSSTTRQRSKRIHRIIDLSQEPNPNWDAQL